MYRQKFLLLFLIIAFEAIGMQYNPDPVVTWAKDNALKRDEAYPYPKGQYHRVKNDFGEWEDADCGHFCYVGQTHGFKSSTNVTGDYVPGKRFEWHYYYTKPKCQDCKMPMYEDGTPRMTDAFEQDYLIHQLHCPYWRWNPSNVPQTYSDVRNKISGVRPGDMFIWYYKDGTAHGGIITDIIGETIKYAAHSYAVLDGDLLKQTCEKANAGVLQYFDIIHFDDMVNGCQQPKYVYFTDSTFRDIFGVRHKWICCWHENLGGEWPWTSNPTAYACLSWLENSGTTWDTLISPRMNFLSCSSVVFKQTSYSNIDGGSIWGSTDDGYTWSQYIGGPSTTEASLPWATNQPSVRIAWCYQGTPSSSKYWCIDDIWLWAKPSRRRDVSVSEIKYPKGIQTQGKSIKPSVFVRNQGLNTESLLVTVKIGSSYTDTKWIKLYALDDTIIEFSSWTAIPGNYTTTCYTNVTEDEFSGNDTATLNFQVAADTWISMFPVYNGGVQSGACITSTGNETLFCVTGRNNFFASYLISQNLWKTRSPVPNYFGSGGCITYANGNYLYALRGFSTKSFYRYQISDNSWTVMSDAPSHIGKGGALAYGGSNYVYALKGNKKKSFYRYNIANNTWETLADTPGKIQEGGSLVWRTGSDFLYALRGDEKRDFYRYQISSNQWTTKESIPAPVGNGGSLAYYPLTRKIYAFCGDDTNAFYVYEISNNHWSTRKQTPYPVKRDACLVYSDCSIYGILGTGYDNDFWRYSPPVDGKFEGEEGENQAQLQLPNKIQYQENAVFQNPPEEQLTYDPTNKFTPQYSPDGNWIAYTAEDSAKECLSLYKIKSIGGAPVSLTSDSITNENPRWSLDKKLITVSGDKGLYKVSVDSTNAVLIVGGITAEPRWFANDSWIIYEKWDSVAKTHNIYKVRKDGTGNTCLLTSSDEYLQPQPVSDSEAICVKLKGEVYQIYKIVNGREIQLTSDYCNSINPSLSSDGCWATYQKLDEYGCWQIYKMNLNDRVEIKLTSNNFHHDTPVFSPDRRYIAYSKWPKVVGSSSGYSQICYIPANGGAEVSLNNPNAIRENPCWSPDNAYIIYQKTVDDAKSGEGRKKHKQLCRVGTQLKYSSISDEEAIKLPKVFALYQNRPNPFRATTAIRYAIPTECLVELDIFDITGRNIKSLVNGKQKPDYYMIKWDGKDNHGKRVSQGIYFYTLRADKKMMQKKMLLLR